MLGKEGGGGDEEGHTQITNIYLILNLLVAFSGNINYFKSLDAFLMAKKVKLVHREYEK